MAIVQRQQSLAESLIQGSDINEQDHRGGTPLVYAISRGFSRLVDLLIKNGADWEIANHTGCNALHVCATHGNSSTTTLVVNAGADVESINPQFGARPLHMAAQCGNWEVVEVLVKLGAMVNERTTGGDTPIFLAASRGHARVVAVLLRAEADYTLNCKGLDAFGIALCLGHQEVLAEFYKKPLDREVTWIKVMPPKALRRYMEVNPGFAVKDAVSELNTFIDAEKSRGEDSIKLAQLEGTRRLFLQADAIFAVSWGWPTTVLRTTIVARGARPFVLKWAKKPRLKMVLQSVSRIKNDLPFLGYV